MDQDVDKTNIDHCDAPAEAKDDVTRSQNAAKGPKKHFDRLALLGILLTVASWIVLSFNGDIALAGCVAAFISGCFGLKSVSRVWHNTAIVAIVASAVLLVVLSAFKIVLYIGLNSI